LARIRCGVVAVIWVALAAVTCAAKPPKETLAAPVVVGNPPPLIVTEVPPLAGPVLGEMEEMKMLPSVLHGPPPPPR
jgi:hypothetical protein